MSGFLEQLKAMVDSHAAEIAALKSAVAAMQAGGAVAAASPAVGGLGAGLSFAATPAVQQQAAVANVTGDMITALIQPHVDNAAIKEALGAEMRAMGVNALPETQPHQYAEMYQRFQGVIARFQGGAAAAPAAASII